ncbi:MAG: hypothetical protein J3K34DRAFT_526773 [Monoraphidium minutum]|nr:MAG: hypothetical protein J3K34DRAFT_526773 [Monoraphidium minutum]
MVLASVFAAAGAVPTLGLQRQPSIGPSTLRSQGSGTLSRQLSGSLRTQASGGLQPTRSGSIAAPPAAPRRASRASLSCAAGADDAFSAAELRTHGSLPLPSGGGAGPAAAHQHHHAEAAAAAAAAAGGQPEVADLDALMASSADGVSTEQFDSYALRHLVQSPPTSTVHLSSLAVTPRRVLRRYAVRSAAGERCVMTLTFEHRGAAPAPGGPAPAPGGWMLSAATGEPAAPGLPAGPAPEHPPEVVVQSVLAALRAVDPFSAWRFMAVNARPALGGSAERFGAALDAPGLRPLLLHVAAAPEARRQAGADRYEETVRLETVTGEFVSYVFTVALQVDGPFEDCWMVEAVARAGGAAAPDACAGDASACAVPPTWGAGDF